VDEPTIRILGPLDVRRDDQPIELGQRRQRLMLGVLALWAGQPVRLGRLAEIAWFGSEPPPSARNGIQVGISRLRTALGTVARITTVGDGYRLDVPRDRVDVFRFRTHVAAARDRAGRARVRALRDAESLWRGPVLAAELPDDARRWLCAGLDEERIAAIEERIAVELDLGHHRELVGELTDLVAATPTRERLVAQLMLALYRDGQAAKALEVGALAKASLAEELGIDAGPEVRGMEVAILRQAPELDAPASRIEVAPTVAPAQLPLDAATFIGRRSELDVLDRMLAPPGHAEQATARIAVITGTAGVGKTALAVRWAHDVRERFPDGQLFTDMRGYAAGTPKRSADALARFLRALGVPGERVSSDVDDAAAAFRSLLADRRVLIVLDNVADADQVRPLLPGGPGCAVVATSRQRLDGLVAHDGARHLSLSVLSSTEARVLLERALGSERVAAEPHAATQLAELCAYLPLALRVAAAALSGAPRRTIADYVATLRGGDRLATLAIDGDPRSAVRSAFDLSYAELGATAREMFRLLGVAPGADVTTSAAAALAGCSPDAAESLLRRLVTAHLVDEVAPGRFALHDLLRLYAAEQATVEDDTEAALDRVITWYVHSARTAGRLVYPHIVRLEGRDAPVPVPADPVQYATDLHAATWLDAERSNLVAVAEFAAQIGRDQTSWLLADALRGYFWYNRHGAEWLPMAETGLAAAIRGHNERAEAAMRLNVAAANHCLARRPAAIEEYTTAKAIARRVGWIEAEEAILTNLGIAYADDGDLGAAVDSYRLALSLARSRRRQAITLVNLGNTLHQMGRLHDAVRQHAAALDLARHANFAGGEASALQYLGYGEHALGDLPRALDHLTMALWVHRRTGNRHQEAQTLMDLAAVYLDEERLVDAESFVERSLALCRERSDLQTQSYVLSTRGRVRLALGQVEDAIADHLAAFDAARQARALYVETVAMIGLANATRATGRYGVALAHARSALSNAERAGYRTLAGEALTVAAAARTQLSDIDGAVEDAEHALILLRHSGYRLAEARALRVLADAVRGDHPTEAERYERAAAKIFDRAHRRAPTNRQDTERLDTGRLGAGRRETEMPDRGHPRDTDPRNADRRAPVTAGDVADRAIADIRENQATSEPRSA
jgi:DNA-binding SARP family transcriptional activator/tetratricopeptide (TPR) repeat protein